MKKTILLSLLWSLCIFDASCQSMSGTEIRKAANAQVNVGLSELMQFLEIPNIGSKEEDILHNLNWCVNRFQKLNFTTQVLSTEGAPLLFAEKTVSKDKKTILFYLQIDGQPVDSSEWDQPNPFVPVIKHKEADGSWKTIDWNTEKKVDPEWRVFGRSSSDSKGPAMAFISALHIFKQRSLQTDFNIKVIMDFQEELGSPTLAKAVEQHRDLLSTDMVLIMDGTRHISNWPTLTYGARGIATATINIYGPKTPLHSGQYGNFAPNPVFEASKFIASLKDEKGRVRIKGFYEGITLSESEKKALNALPENEDSLKIRLGIAQSDQVGGSYQESLQYPSLNIRGLRAAWVGKEVRTIIPDVVVIEIDMRLVSETPGERMVNLLEEHLITQGYHLVDSIPTDLERRSYPKLAALKYRLGSQPFRTEMDSEAGVFLNNAMRPVFGTKVVNMRTTGGSQPIAPFVRTLGVPAVSIRIPNPDNNIHAPNENLRMGNFLEGIMMCLAILNEPLQK